MSSPESIDSLLLLLRLGNHGYSDQDQFVVISTFCSTTDALVKDSVLLIQLFVVLSKRLSHV